MRPLINFLRRVKHYTCGNTESREKLIQIKVKSYVMSLILKDADKMAL